MIPHNNVLGALIAQASTGYTPFQQCTSSQKCLHNHSLAAETRVDHFRENGDISTALAMQEVALLHNLDSISAGDNARLLKYCDIYLEITERLKLILGREVPTLPPLHLFLLLAQEKRFALLATPIRSRLVSMKDYFGRSLLHVALDHGTVVSVIHRFPFDVSTTSGDAWGRWPIHIACSGSPEALVAYVVYNTVDCDVEDCFGRSALHYASSCGKESSVQLLLKQGARVGRKDRDGRAPMSWAARHGHTAVVQLLLNNDADIDSRDNNGNTALFWAIKHGHTAVVHLLRKNGADTRYRDDYNKKRWQSSF